MGKCLNDDIVEIIAKWQERYIDEILVKEYNEAWDTLQLKGQLLENYILSLKKVTLSNGFIRTI